MSSLRVGRVVAASWRVWRRDLRSLTALAAALELPLVVVELALHVVPGLRSFADNRATLGAGAVLLALYSSLSHHFLAGLLERVVGSERHGHPRPELAEVLTDLPWHRLVGADLLLTAMVVVGLVLFVVPGLVLLTWFSLTLPLVNLERRPVVASFARSRQLVRGHFWPVFVVALGAFAIPELAIGAAAAVTHQLTHDPAVQTLAHAGAAILLMPIAALPVVVMTFDLVDLERAATAPDLAPS